MTFDCCLFLLPLNHWWAFNAESERSVKQSQIGWYDFLLYKNLLSFHLQTFFICWRFQCYESRSQSEGWTDVLLSHCLTENSSSVGEMKILSEGQLVCQRFLWCSDLWWPAGGDVWGMKLLHTLENDPNLVRWHLLVSVDLHVQVCGAGVINSSSIVWIYLDSPHCDHPPCVSMLALSLHCGHGGGRL